MKKIAADRNYRILKSADDGDFVQKVMTSGHPDLAEARDNLLNAIGTVLMKEGFIGSLGNSDRLKSMWDGMKDEQIRSVEYSALYTYLYQVFGKELYR